MKTFSILLLLLFSTPSVYGRIGETPQQCKARYGDPVHLDAKTKNAGFIKAGFNISATFKGDGGVCSIIYIEKSKKDILGTSEEISDIELKTFLKANGGGSEWRETEGAWTAITWITKDGLITAQYDKLEHELIIITMKCMSQINKERKEAEKENLDEF